jgi:hypothetical protein
VFGGNIDMKPDQSSPDKIGSTLKDSLSQQIWDIIREQNSEEHKRFSDRIEDLEKRINDSATKLQEKIELAANNLENKLDAKIQVVNNRLDVNKGNVESKFDSMDECFRGNGRIGIFEQLRNQKLMMRAAFLCIALLFGLKVFGGTIEDWASSLWKSINRPHAAQVQPSTRPDIKDFTVSP